MLKERGGLRFEMEGEEGIIAKKVAEKRLGWIRRACTAKSQYQKPRSTNSKNGAVQVHRRAGLDLKGYALYPFLGTIVTGAKSRSSQVGVGACE
jgi:hypothetical protein